MFGEPHRQICPLFSGTSETVLLQKLAPGEPVFCAPRVGGAELLLLKGQLGAQEDCYEAGSWLRFPPGDMPALMAIASGALFYLKTGHLSPTPLTGAT